MFSSTSVSATRSRGPPSAACLDATLPAATSASAPITPPRRGVTPQVDPRQSTPQRIRRAQRLRQRQRAGVPDRVSLQIQLDARGRNAAAAAFVFVLVLVARPRRRRSRHRVGDGHRPASPRLLYPRSNRRRLREDARSSASDDNAVGVCAAFSVVSSASPCRVFAASNISFDALPVDEADDLAAGDAKRGAALADVVGGEVQPRDAG